MLVEACLSGDTSAFGRLVDTYERPLYNAALRITNSRDDAMDATQSAFVKAYEKLHTFNSSYRFFSWIYRIAVNEALNIVQRKGREQPSRNVMIPTEWLRPTGLSLTTGGKGYPPTELIWLRQLQTKLNQRVNLCPGVSR